MSNWEQQIEQDLAWREAEMGSLKLLLASAPTGSDRQRALLRANSAMLYAHYEGFCKFCWTLMLSAIEGQAHQRLDLIEPLAKRAMALVFRSLRGNTSDEGLWKFGCRDFDLELKSNATFSEDVDTESNLWPVLAQRINESVGLKCPLFAAHEPALRQLVGRRNKIAHGEKLEIADLAQFQQFEHAAIIVMHELAIAVVECLNNRTFLRPVADAAALI